MNNEKQPKLATGAAGAEMPGRADRGRKKRKEKKTVVESPWAVAFKRLRKNKLAMIGLIALVVITIVCVFGPLFSPYGLNENNLTDRYLSPFSTGRSGNFYLLGTDSTGRDVFTRLLYGGQISLLVGLVAVIIQLFIGIILGGLAGYYGGWVDSIIMRIVDIFLAIPTFPILILLSALMSDMGIPAEYRIYVVMFIIGILSWAQLTRFIRGEILSLREQEFMMATEALGIRDRSRIFRHLIPNVIPQIIVNATLGIGSAILFESTLSFLGLGVTPPMATWGTMVQAVNDSFDFANRPWLWLPAGLMIFITVLAINLLGDGLRDAFDPKMKK